MSQEGGVQFQALFWAPILAPKTSGILHLNLRNNLGLFWLGRLLNVRRFSWQGRSTAAPEDASVIL